MNIKIFYVSDGKNNDEYTFVFRKANKEIILALVKYVTSSKTNKINQDNIKYEKRLKHVFRMLTKKWNIENYTKEMLNQNLV